MRWAVQLTGEEADFKLLEPCFQSNDLRIVKHDELSFLESERLNSFTDANGVWAVADELLTQLHTTFHLFAGASPRFALGFAQPYSDDGAPLLGGRAVRAALTINVVCPQGITKLASSAPNGTFGSHVVSRAAADSTVRAALAHMAPRKRWRAARRHPRRCLTNRGQAQALCSAHRRNAFRDTSRAHQDRLRPKAYC